ncbi:uncharacterized protein LOC127007142 [Eriocheir sinensis]|uniref:uncharacterized protein LOC127007142 n=1 Tax=Eriocheir sinensis TaxID=95602 RepID=UPI0021C79F7A|nr:uncharacterized protein LOC127007142 [Eriocheir sinensis]
MNRMADYPNQNASKQRLDTDLKLLRPPESLTKRRRKRKRKGRRHGEEEEEEKEDKSRFSLCDDLSFPMIDDVTDDLTTRNLDPPDPPEPPPPPPTPLPPPPPPPPPPPAPPSSPSSSSSSSSTPTGDSSSSSFSLDDIGEDVAELAEQLCDATSEAGHLITKELKEGIHYVTRPEDTMEFGWLDALTCLVSIVTFYFELVSDALVAFYLYDDPAAKHWFMASVVLLVAPLVLVNGFSLYWYWFDEVWCQESAKHPRPRPWLWAVRIVGHLLLQAPVFRQLDILHYGNKSLAETVLEEASVDQVMLAASCEVPALTLTPASPPAHVCTARPPLQGSTSILVCRAHHRRTECFGRWGSFVARWIHAERDATNVELLQALSQAAPLLILNLYVMTRTLPAQTRNGHYSQTLVAQIFSEWSSLLTLAWSVSSFVRATRLTEPSLSNLSILDQTLLTLAHFCSIVSQVMSFALFASQLVISFFIVATLHWLLMTCWVLVQLTCFPRTTCTRAFFAHDRRRGLCHQLDDIFYSGMMGLVFLFTFVDVGGVKGTRTKSFVYQMLIFLEQMVLLSLWLVWSGGTTWYHWLPLLLSPALCCLNLAFMACFSASVKPEYCLPLAKQV